MPKVAKVNKFLQKALLLEKHAGGVLISGWPSYLHEIYRWIRNHFHTTKILRVDGRIALGTTWLSIRHFAESNVQKDDLGRGSYWYIAAGLESQFLCIKNWHRGPWPSNTKEQKLPKMDINIHEKMILLANRLQPLRLQHFTWNVTIVFHPMTLLMKAPLNRITKVRCLNWCQRLHYSCHIY